jgi:hypothetical protein
VSAPASAIGVEDLGRPIRGPRALTDDWSRFWHLTYNIARNEFKLRFFGSALGYLWQLVRPLLFFAVLYVFFTKVADVTKGQGPSGKFYGAQLLSSIVLFTFFQEATGGAVRSVVDRENLVRKIQFPRLVIPLSIVLLACFNLALNLIVVLGFALIEGVRPMLSWLELPLIVAMLAVFATGIAMLLSALFVKFRDVLPIWEAHQRERKAQQPAVSPLHAQPARLDLPAVPARDRHACDAQRRAGPRQLGSAARADGHRRGCVRPRLLGLQPLRAARGGEPLDVIAEAACSGVRGSRGGSRPRRRSSATRAPASSILASRSGTAIPSWRPMYRRGLVATMFIDTPPQTWLSQAR